nr:MAG TPA: hypothetical protein [Bacteriophage sp.]
MVRNWYVNSISKLRNADKYYVFKEVKLKMKLGIVIKSHF